MNKEQFINLVSKVDQTSEDEFKAEYNSPELIWEKVVEPLLQGKIHELFCPNCGHKKDFKVSTDINSGKVCKNVLCKLK